MGGFGRTWWAGAVAIASAVVSSAALASASDPAVVFASFSAPLELGLREVSESGTLPWLPIGALDAPLASVRVAAGDAGAMAAVTIDQGGQTRLFLRARRTSPWSGGQVLTTTVGDASLPVADVQIAGAPGVVLVAYRASGSSLVHYRTAAGGTITPEATVDLGLVAPPDQLLLASHPASGQMMLVARAGPTLVACPWDASGFLAPFTLSTTCNTTGQPVAAAFESASGRALLLWAEGGIARYRVFGDRAWSSRRNAVSGSHSINVIKLASSPAPEAATIVAALSTARGRLSAHVWNGSKWRWASTLESSLGHTGTEERFGLAWQADAALAVAVWCREGTAVLRSRTFDGRAWSRIAAGPTLASNPRQILAGPGPGTNMITTACRLAPVGTSIQDYLVYAQRSLTLGSVTVLGMSASGNPAISLPPPPVSTFGSGNSSFGPEAVVTLAPGLYRDYSFDQACTINLSAGTYRFRTLDLSASIGLRINADTAEGDINLVINRSGLRLADNSTILVTGGGAVFVHVIRGNVVVGSTLAANDTHLRAYRGNVTIGSTLSLGGTIWGSSRIKFASGTVSPAVAAEPSTPPSSLVVVPVDSGFMTPPATVAPQLLGGPTSHTFDLPGRAGSRGASILGWTQVNSTDP